MHYESSQENWGQHYSHILVSNIPAQNPAPPSFAILGEEASHRKSRFNEHFRLSTVGLSNPWKGKKAADCEKHEEPEEVGQEALQDTSDQEDSTF